jgi:hypothetical protein
LKTAWLMGLPEPERSNAEKIIRSSKPVLERLYTILSSLAEEVERKGYSEDDYKTPDWMALQAFRNGKISMARQIMDLIRLDA